MSFSGTCTLRSVGSIVLDAVMAFEGLSVLEVRSDDSASAKAAPLLLNFPHLRGDEDSG